MPSNTSPFQLGLTSKVVPVAIPPPECRLKVESNAFETDISLAYVYQIYQIPNAGIKKKTLYNENF